MRSRFEFDKRKRIEKLSINEQEDILFDFLNAFRVLKTDEETALFVRDLLTASEVKILAKRLRIAKLLSEGKTYDQVEKIVHASHGTVAKVARWLSEKGEGFRKVLSRIPKVKERRGWGSMSEGERFMHRYSIYFWPELLIKEIFKGGKEINRKKLYEVLDDLREKRVISKEIEKEFKSRYSKKYSTT